METRFPRVHEGQHELVGRCCTVGVSAHEHPAAPGLYREATGKTRAAGNRASTPRRGIHEL